GGKGSGRLRVIDGCFLDPAGRPVETVTAGSLLDIVVRYRTAAAGATAEVALSCWSAEGYKIFHVDNRTRGVDLAPLKREGRYVCRLARPPLVPGGYQVNVLVAIDGRGVVHDPSAPYSHVV